MKYERENKREGEKGIMAVNESLGTRRRHCYYLYRVIV